MRYGADRLEERVVPLAWRPPFALGEPAYVAFRPAGETILAMVLSVPDLPREFMKRGVVCINGEPVPRHLWDFARPKPNTPKNPIGVTMHLPLGKGGSSGA